MVPVRPLCTVAYIVIYVYRSFVLATFNNSRVEQSQVWLKLIIVYSFFLFFRRIFNFQFAGGIHSIFLAEFSIHLLSLIAKDKRYARQTFEHDCHTGDVFSPSLQFYTMNNETCTVQYTGTRVISTRGATEVTKLVPGTGASVVLVYRYHHTYVPTVLHTH